MIGAWQTSVKRFVIPRPRCLIVPWKTMSFLRGRHRVAMLIGMCTYTHDKTASDCRAEPAQPENRRDLVALYARRLELNAAKSAGRSSRLFGNEQPLEDPWAGIELVQFGRPMREAILGNVAETAEEATREDVVAAPWIPLMPGGYSLFWAHDNLVNFDGFQPLMNGLALSLGRIQTLIVERIRPSRAGRSSPDIRLLG
jgi:hypothetical protein